MVLRHSNDRVARKHYIKPPTIEAIAAMQRFSRTFSALEKPKLLHSCSPKPAKEAEGKTKGPWAQ
jgi:hypothetical protein